LNNHSTVAGKENKMTRNDLPMCHTQEVHGEVVQRIKGELPDTATLYELSDFFKIFGDSTRVCKCTEAQLERYRKKLSGPMMDRIDMRISMEKVEYDELRRKPVRRSRDAGKSAGVTTAEMRRTVETGLAFAHEMGRKTYNSGLSESDTEKYCTLGSAEEKFMNRAYDALKMTPRSYKKTLKVARTIADIACSEKIREEHLAEALSYRLLDAVNE
jgi:magnesium chelatase family protein